MKLSEFVEELNPIHIRLRGEHRVNEYRDTELDIGLLKEPTPGWIGLDDYW